MVTIPELAAGKDREYLIGLYNNSLTTRVLFYELSGELKC